MDDHGATGRDVNDGATGGDVNDGATGVTIIMMTLVMMMMVHTRCCY